MIPTQHGGAKMCSHNTTIDCFQGLAQITRTLSDQPRLSGFIEKVNLNDLLEYRVVPFYINLPW